jgi:hypothetical protein
VQPAQDTVVDPASGVTAANVEAGPSQVGEGIPDVSLCAGDCLSQPYKRPVKRPRASSMDSDDLDAAPTAGPSNGAAIPQPLKAPGELMNCGQCGVSFTVVS